MDQDAVIHSIVDTFEGVRTVNADGNTFFFYDPEHRFPFATLVTNDAYDQASNLNRPSVFRLNIGISKQTYRALFGAQPSPSDAGGGGDGGYDFTALDQVMPHPVYGRQYWVCVLNPSTATFQAMVRPLLAEAYDLDVRKYAKRMAHTGGPPMAQTTGDEPKNDFPSGLAQPALRALSAAGYTRLEQLTRVTEADLLNLHGMGPKALGLLGSALHARGLSFADPDNG